MLAFLENRVRKPTGPAALEARRKMVQTVHTVVSGGFHRLSDHVPDPQNFNIAQNDMISTTG